jgi:hypothetical protein
MRARLLHRNVVWRARRSAATALEVAPEAAAAIEPPATSTGHAHGEIALRLTAVALLLRPMGPWFVRPVILAIAVLMIALPKKLRSPWAWGLVSAMIGIRIGEDWPLADNHIFLLDYWTLAIALSLRSARAAPTLADTSRWLVGLAFAFAVCWKVVLSPDFLDGRFFRVTLLTDPRFGDAAQLIGGLSAEQLAANREALRSLPDGVELLHPPMLVEPPALRTLATASTWGIVLLETAVALLMLLPLAATPSTLRHVSLLLFCGVTYLFAPVAGFGWLLLAMGVAQLEAGEAMWRRAYVGAFLIVIFYDEIPWAELTLGALGR